MSFVKKHELLYSSQYSFHKRHSTQHVILDIVHDNYTDKHGSMIAILWNIH